MRLDQAVGQALGVSRKRARQLIVSGSIQVAGATVLDSGLRLANTDDLSCDGVALALPTAHYYMLNKPAGYVCTRGDAHHPSVFELLPRVPDLQAVGRLDADTLGLVLLTDDGQWNHRVTSPRRQCAKHYRVTLAAPLASGAYEALMQGVLLRDDPHPTLPARLQPQSATEFDLWITEGRYHQVKRMVAAVGGHVSGLQRLAVGSIKLDPQLAPGTARALTNAEIAAFAD